MDIKITFKNLDHTPSLDARIEKKSLRLEKFFEGRSSIQWICFTDGINHHAEITLEGPNFRINATGSDKNLYHALDKVISKIEIQLRKQKEKWKNPIHHKHPEFNYIKGREEALNEMAETSRQEKKKSKKRAA